MGDPKYEILPHHEASCRKQPHETSAMATVNKGLVHEAESQRRGSRDGQPTRFVGAEYRRRGAGGILHTGIDRRTPGMTHRRGSRIRPTFTIRPRATDNGYIRHCFDVPYRLLPACLSPSVGPYFCLSLSHSVSLVCAAQTHDENLKRTTSTKIDSRKINKSGAKFSKAPRMAKSGSLEDVVSQIAPGADGSNHPHGIQSCLSRGLSYQRVSQRPSPAGIAATAY